MRSGHLRLAYTQQLFGAQPEAVTVELDVAQAVLRAATDESNQLRFPAGPDALALARSANNGLLVGRQRQVFELDDVYIEPA